MENVLAILLAGGAGERLYPLTKDTAKPAVPFGGAYRIIDFTLSNCINSNVRRIFILTQYKALDLIRHVRDGWNILSPELGEYVEIIPPMKQMGEEWYQGTADAVFQNTHSILAEAPEHILILSGDADASAVDLLNVGRQAELRQFPPVGAEGVGFDEVGPRLHVAAVDLPDQARVAQVQLIEAAIEEHPMLIQHRPHRPVSDQDALGDKLIKGGSFHFLGLRACELRSS
jgi:GTP:adenosylcobinamide-phosphate guanylyltransferase